MDDRVRLLWSGKQTFSPCPQRAGFGFRAPPWSLVKLRALWLNTQKEYAVLVSLERTKEEGLQEQGLQMWGNGVNIVYMLRQYQDEKVGILAGMVNR